MFTHWAMLLTTVCIAREALTNSICDLVVKSIPESKTIDLFVCIGTMTLSPLHCGLVHPSSYPFWLNPVSVPLSPLYAFIKFLDVKGGWILYGFLWPWSPPRSLVWSCGPCQNIPICSNIHNLGTVPGTPTLIITNQTNCMQLYSLWILLNACNCLVLCVLTWCVAHVHLQVFCECASVWQLVAYENEYFSLGSGQCNGLMCTCVLMYLEVSV